MTNLSAFWIATSLALGFAPWYVVALLMVGVVVCFVAELP